MEVVMNKIWMLGLLVFGVEQMHGMDIPVNLPPLVPLTEEDGVEDNANIAGQAVAGLLALAGNDRASSNIVSGIQYYQVLPSIQNTLLSSASSSVKDKAYACNYKGCSVQFSRLSSLETHKRIHKLQDWKKFINKNAQNNNKLVMASSSTATKAYVCNYKGCSVQFPRLSSLDTHKRIHKLQDW
jgi:hypothetical protein